MGGRLSASEAVQFHEQGYLVVIEAVRVGYAARLAEVAERLYRVGRLSGTFADLPFEERYIAILRESPDFYQHLNISLPLENDFPADADMFAGVNVTAENYIPAALLAMDNVVPLPVGRGGVVLLHQYTEHSALANTTHTIRWSFDLRYNPVRQPTGRPAFPGFVARSRQNPESVLTDPDAWAQLWWAAWERILSGQEAGPIFNEARWTAYRDAPVCA